ncbi:MAG: type 1 glutamine amidotransferase [Methanothrix sp.]|nr:type 1 glutamine amidotransferase [Methanothrix sp.]
MTNSLKRAAKDALSMRIHYLLHVPFEDLANIEGWARPRGHDLSRTLLFSEEGFPDLSSFDWLIIMGGPMNIYDHERYPWLVREKEFIRQAIAGGKIVLGICLGAQLISDVLGGKVTGNRYREIGWFPVRLTEEGRASSIFSALPDGFTALHWHGDMFSIPPGALRLAESDACANQAFIFGRSVGLQFHLESSKESIERLLENCGDDLTEGPYVQGREDLASQEDYAGIRQLMEMLLDRIENVFGY